MGYLPLWMACHKRVVEYGHNEISRSQYLQLMLGVEKPWQLPFAMVGAAGSGLRRRIPDE